MTSEHQVRRNEAFGGLCQQSGQDICNYAHFRNVQSLDKKAALDEPAASFNSKFLEDAG
jgi:hypothetical protein